MDHSYFTHESTPMTKRVVSGNGTMSKDNTTLVDTEEKLKIDSITLKEIQITSPEEAISNEKNVNSAEFVNEDHLPVVTANIPIIYGSTLNEIKTTNKPSPNLLQQNKYENKNSLEPLDVVLSSMVAATDILKSWALTDDDNTEELPESKEETSVSTDTETGLNEAGLAHKTITPSRVKGAVCQCQTCYNYFTTITAFLQHYWLSCTLCNYTLKNYEAYKLHVASKHRYVRQRPLPISKCTLSIEQPVSESPQKAISEFQVCEACGNFFTEDVIQEHFLFACPTCECAFDKESKCRRHILEDHKTADLEPLRNCTVKNLTKIGNLYHPCREKQKTDIKCPNCNTYFPNNGTFLAHFRYICRICNFESKHYVEYRKHLTVSHESKNLAAVRKCTRKRVTCIVCSKTFKYEGSVIRHQLLQHRVWSEGEPVKHKCPCCWQVFDTHKNTTHDIEKCFIKHSGKVKIKTKKHLLPISGKDSCEANKLTHHNLTHTGEKHRECPTCGKKFRSTTSLKLHERIHTSEKPYSCEFCGKLFRKYNAFRVHLSSHTGEKPYVCKLCKRGFTTNQGLKQHSCDCDCSGPATGGSTGGGGREGNHPPRAKNVNKKATRIYKN